MGGNREGLHMILNAALTGIAMLLCVASAGAQTHQRSQLTVVAQAKVAPVVDAEVRKVDKEAGKITLKHDPIPNLEMPSMTMVFRVKESTMLDQVQVGDKVRFSAEKVGGQFTITAIEVSK